MSQQATESRVGQTMMGIFKGQPVPLECIKDNGGRVAWRSLDLQFAGDMQADLWDLNRRRQQDAINAETEEG